MSARPPGASDPGEAQGAGRRSRRARRQDGGAPGTARGREAGGAGQAQGGTAPPHQPPAGRNRQRRPGPRESQDRGGTEPRPGHRFGRQGAGERIEGVACCDQRGRERDAPRRRRSVRSGRSGTQIASVGGSSNLAAPDMVGSAIEGQGISIAAITDLAVDGGGSGDGFSAPGGGGSPGADGARNDYRSNESLLAVVRRYAPGIQFCYDNELKKQPRSARQTRGEHHRAGQWYRERGDRGRRQARFARNHASACSRRSADGASPPSQAETRASRRRSYSRRPISRRVPVFPLSGG